MNCLGICSSFSLVYRFFCIKLQSIALLLTSAQSIDQLGGLLWPGWQRCWWLLSTSNSPVLIQPPHPRVPCCPVVWPQSSIWRSSPGWGWLYWQIFPVSHSFSLSLVHWFSLFPPVPQWVLTHLSRASVSVLHSHSLGFSSNSGQLRSVSLQTLQRLPLSSSMSHFQVLCSWRLRLTSETWGELFNSKFTPVLCCYIVLGVVLNMVVQCSSMEILEWT